MFLNVKIWKTIIVFLSENFTFKFMAIFVFTESSQETMPNLGFIPISCNLVDEFTRDILKDLPFLKR